MKKLAVVKVILSIVYLALIALIAVSFITSFSNVNTMHSEQELNRLLATIIITAVLILFAISLLIFVIVRYKQNCAKDAEEEQQENIQSIEE